MNAEKMYNVGNISIENIARGVASACRGRQELILPCFRLNEQSFKEPGICRLRADSGCTPVTALRITTGLDICSGDRWKGAVFLGMTCSLAGVHWDKKSMLLMSLMVAPEKRGYESS